MDDYDFDLPVLSGDALAALQDFYAQRDKENEVFESLRSSALQDAKPSITSITSFKEDWNTSQFWFTDTTASFLARQLLHNVTTETNIAVISAPSVFVQLQNLLATGEYPTPSRVCLLEYDNRFELLGDFVRYDFNNPTSLPSTLEHAFDRILCDPPYHSQECILKFADTVSWLRNDSGNPRIAQMQLVCTGETMESTVLKSFHGTRKALFDPEHTNRLQNKYACFADFQLRD